MAGKEVTKVLELRLLISECIDLEWKLAKTFS